MRQLRTHIVIDAGEADLFVSTAEEYIDLDYNDFSVEAYIHLATNHGPKPGTHKAEVAKLKSRCPLEESLRLKILHVAMHLNGLLTTMTILGTTTKQWSP